jgi:hypothetical protein
MNREFERDERDAALIRVEAATSAAFQAAVLDAIRHRATGGSEFNADEIRSDLAARGIIIERPTAMGAVFAQAARSGWIVRSGGKRATDVNGGHARSYDLWRGSLRSLPGGAMTDQIAVEEFEARPEPRRDQWGRYLVVPPNGGKPVGYTRATTVAKTLDSGGGLANWKAAMCAIGIIRQRGQRAQWEALMAETNGDPWYGSAESKAATKELVEHCADIGGANDRRDVGSALHAITAVVDSGRTPAHLTEETARDIATYTTTRDEAGVSVLSDYIETTVVLDGWEVAGTFDRLAILPDFDLPLIADLKTGGDLDYSWGPIAVQLASYSRANAVYVQGSAKNGSEDQRLPMPAVCQTHGLVFWLRDNQMSMHLIDLEAGWDAFEHSMWTRGWRKLTPSAKYEPDTELLRLLQESVAIHQQPPEVPQSASTPDPLPALREWLQGRIDAVGSHQEARKDLVSRWPTGLAPLVHFDGHTEQQLAEIEHLLDLVEGRHGLPFGAPKPGMEEQATGTVLRLFPGTTQQPPTSEETPA